jgi:hypothetical protein
MAKIKYDLPNDGFIMYKTADAELFHSTYLRNREMERKSRRYAELSMHNSDSAAEGITLLGSYSDVTV